MFEKPLIYFIKGSLKACVRLNSFCITLKRAISIGYFEVLLSKGRVAFILLCGVVDEIYMGRTIKGDACSSLW